MKENIYGKKQRTNDSEKSTDNISPLFEAILWNQLGVVKRLVKTGADFTEQNDQGEFPIEVARKQGDNAMITLVHLHSINAVEKDPDGRAERLLSRILFPQTLRLR